VIWSVPRGRIASGSTFFQVASSSVVIVAVCLFTFSAKWFSDTCHCGRDEELTRGRQRKWVSFGRGGGMLCFVVRLTK
jgi:hypothetical protein